MIGSDFPPRNARPAHPNPSLRFGQAVDHITVVVAVSFVGSASAAAAILSVASRRRLFLVSRLDRRGCAAEGPTISARQAAFSARPRSQQHNLQRVHLITRANGVGERRVPEMRG
jgi:hypothetical protein